MISLAIKTYFGLLLSNSILDLFNPSTVEIKSILLMLFIVVNVFSYVQGIYILIYGALNYVEFTKIIFVLMGLAEVISFAILAPEEMKSGGQFAGLGILLMIFAYVPDLVNMITVWLLM